MHPLSRLDCFPFVQSHEVGHALYTAAVAAAVVIGVDMPVLQYCGGRGQRSVCPLVLIVMGAVLGLQSEYIYGDATVYYASTRRSAEWLLR